MRFLAFLMSVFVIAGNASACECNYELLSDQTVRKSGSVAIVEIRELKSDEKETVPSAFRSLNGTLKVIDILSGERPGTQFKYSVDSCCGIRLDVGHYYILFLEHASGRIVLTPGNLMHFSAPDAIDPRRIGLMVKVLEGEMRLEEAFGESPSGKLMQMQVPVVRPESEQ